METIDNVKRRIIISMISILLLIITIFGITYAYFLANVKGNENDKSVSVTAGKLELIYDDEDSIIIAEKIKPGITLEEKVFSVANTGTAKVDNYDVVLENVINELKYYEDLTYILTCKSYKSTDYETNGTKSLEYGTCNGSEGIFPKYDNTLVTNSIDKDVTHYYTLKVTYHETYIDQSDDMNKKVSARVNIEDNNYNMKKLMIYGNSIQSAEPSNDVPVEIQSVGDKTDNLFNNANIDLNNVYAAKNIESTDTGIKFVTTAGGGQVNVVIGLAKDFEGKTLVFSSPNYYNTVATSFAIREVSGTHLIGGTNWTKSGDVYYSTITVPENGYTTEELCLRLYFSNMNIGDEIEYNDLMVAYGNTPKEYEQYGKYKIPLTIRSKNLYDSSTYPLIAGEWIAAGSGSIGSSEDLARTNFIPCVDLRGKEISLNHTKGQNPGIAFYDANKEFISGVPNKQGNFITTIVPENASYLIFAVDANYINEIQLEYGNISTNYEPYIEPITTNIYLDEPLRKVNDVSDYLDFANNRIVRNVDVQYFNGTENWLLYDGNTGDGGKVFYLDDAVIQQPYFKDIMSNYFKNSSDTGALSTWVVGEGRFQHNMDGIASSKRLYLSMNIQKISEFKNWLNNKNMYVIFSLKTPKEEPINMPNLSGINSNLILEVNTSLEPSKIEY